VVLFEGPSEFDQQPIAVILTGFDGSSNDKTGPMLQSWIMRSGMDPITALKQGADASVCGNCRLRDGGCYVNVGRAVSGVFKAFDGGNYEKYDPSDHDRYIRGRHIRLGAYGDPAAVPFEAWGRFLKLAAGHTGYTHAWRYCDQRYRELCMASCDSRADLLEARVAGWRTFRIRLPDEPLMENEFVCPAAEEGGKTRQCFNCLACSGGSPERGSPCIVAHGWSKSLLAYVKVRGEPVAV
jgi:hypothetical protein